MTKLQAILLALVFAATSAVAAPYAGFFLPDSLNEFTLRFKKINGLIVLPVTINDSVEVNLILDTGCRNTLLFGKRFSKELATNEKPVYFSGLGNGSRVKGALAENNRIVIGAVVGNRIPVIVVPQKNLFANFSNIHGIIGYEIFIKFEIEINFSKHTITFRPASQATKQKNFSYTPMEIVDSRPLIQAVVETESSTKTIHKVLIDTGSSLGLLIGENNAELKTAKTVGRGLNGMVNGLVSSTKRLRINDIEFRNVETSIIFSNDNYASIGMKVLSDYVVVINYCKEYAGFKRTEA
jgi:hypothetical protein